MKLLPDFILLLFALILGVAFLSPILYLNGYEQAADLIQRAYQFLCHQRVERSLFIGGQNGLFNFYSLDDLREAGAIPLSNPHVPLAYSTDHYHYPYVGNSEIGYKVALCIRDIGMYSGLILAGIFSSLYYYKKKAVLKIRPLYLVILMIPMAVDGVFQTAAGLLGWDWVSQGYIDNIEKRIITGFIFGVGFALFVFPLLRENVNMMYEDEKSRNKE